MQKLVLTTAVIDMWHRVHGRHQLGTSSRVNRYKTLYTAWKGGSYWAYIHKRHTTPVTCNGQS